MIEIIDISKKYTQAVAVNSINAGQVFKGRLGSYKSVFLKIHSEIVDLRNPSNVWHEECARGLGLPKEPLTVYEYQPVTAIMTIS